MKWVGTSNLLPEHGQEILIRSRSIVNLAVFNKNTSKFVLKDGTTLDSKEQIKWCGLVNDEKKKVYHL
jgi:hypothetical protein